MTDVLILEGVSKSFASHTAVDDLSFSVPAGIVYGVLGPNGAGKTTTLRMIMNILARDSGSIDMLGADPERSPLVLRQVGYLPEERGLYRKMKVLDVIVFFARLKGMDGADARRDARTWLDRLGLAEWQDAKIETLSKGMQQKVQFITTVLHGPDLLVLDEPFSGLDPVNQVVLRETVLEWKRARKTVLFCTHVMEQAERICDRICIIADGRKVLEGELREIRRGAATDRYEIEFAAESSAVEGLMGDSRWFARASHRNGRWEAQLSEGTDSQQVLAELATLDVPVLRFVRVEPSLHEIFVDRVGTSGAARRQAVGKP